MLSVFIYPACLLMFGICLVVIEVLRRRGASYNTIILSGGVLGVLTLLLQYMPPPEWLMADFNKAYYPAGQAAIEDHAALTDLLAKGVYGFVNLPIVAFLFSPFAVMPLRLADLIFLGLGGLSCILLWRELARFAQLEAPESALLLFLAIGSGPAAYGVANGNTSQMVLILIIWGIMAFMRGKDLSAGALFALAALVKPALIVFGIFTLLRGRWKVTAAGAAVCAAATLMSIAIFGWPMHEIWLQQTILPALDGTILAHNVQSISGAVGRAFVGPEWLNDWNPHTVPATASLLATGLKLLTAAIIVASLVILARRKAPAQTAPLEFSFVLMALLLLPNLAWNHYFVWAFIPLALCLKAMPPLMSARGETLAALLSAALIAQPVFMWESSSALTQDIFGRVIVSLPFLGAVILLVLMVRQVLRLRQSDEVLNAEKPVTNTVSPTALRPPLRWRPGTRTT
ncbi:glycosyltransferase family 87 protein [Henriciella sp. AS95]|uniref:glycosyltransferase family 87 protein n=1 Tax=Henriciella sp. AS95 TaxID=3135782 RepID=UPI00317AA620